MPCDLILEACDPINEQSSADIQNGLHKKWAWQLIAHYQIWMWRYRKKQQQSSELFQNAEETDKDLTVVLKRAYIPIVKKEEARESTSLLNQFIT